jgi:hypothetical protein
MLNTAKNIEKLRVQRAQYYADNCEAIKARKAQWYTDNKEAVKAYDAQRYKDNTDEMKVRSAQYRKNNIDAAKAYDAQYCKQYYKDNKAAADTRSTRYYKANREQENIRRGMWRKNNPHKVALLAADRKFKLELATPRWSEIEEIKIVYLKRDEYRTLFSIPFEVDHIIPITSNMVCGLHVLANLQLLDKSLNSGKNNNYQTDW